jgi:hypothetical protein
MVVLTFCTSPFSQSTKPFVGRVIGKGQNLEYANVMLLNGGKLLLYTKTDTSGLFRLNVEQAKLAKTLQITHVSTSSQFFAVDSLLKLEKDTVEFFLVEKGSTLNDVIILGRNKTYSQRGDTTSIAIGKFSDSTELNLEDIFKKLPGFNVTNNGKITFKGKEISRLLIDGSEMYGNDYSIGTKAITPFIFDSVQAIENFNTNPILKSITGGSETVVNLVLKNNQQSKVKGAAGIKLGNRYDNDLDLYKFSKAQKFIGLYTGNNNGDQEKGYENSAGGVIKDFEVVQSISQYYQHGVPSAGVQGDKLGLINSTHLGDFKYSKNNKGRTTNIDITLFTDRVRQNESEYEVLTNKPDSLVNAIETNFIEKQNKVEGIVTTKGMRKKSFNQFVFGINTSFGDSENRYGVNNIRIHERTNRMLLNSFVGYDKTVKVSEKKAIQISSYFLGHSGLNDINLFPFQPYTLIGLDSVCDRFKQQTITGSIQTQVNYFVSKNGFDTKMGIGHQYLISSNKFYLNRTPNLDSIISDFGFNDNRFSLQFKTQKKWKKVGASADVSLSYFKTSFEQASLKKVQPDYKFLVEYKPIKNLFFLSAISNQNILPAYLSFNSKPLFADYRSIKRGVDSAFLIRQHSFFFLGNYTNFLKGIESGYSILYIRKRNDVYTDIQFRDNQFLNQSFVGPPNGLFSGAVYGGGFLPVISSYLKLELRYSSNDVIYAFNQALVNSTLSTQNFIIEYRSSFLSKVNFLIKSNLNIVAVNTKTSAQTFTSTNLTLSGKLRYTIPGKLFVSIEPEYYELGSSIPIQENDRSNFVYLNFDVRIPLKWKGGSFTMKGQNLLDVRNQFSYNSDGFLNNVAGRSFLGRSILLGIDVMF